VIDQNAQDWAARVEKETNTQVLKMGESFTF